MNDTVQLSENIADSLRNVIFSNLSEIPLEKLVLPDGLFDKNRIDKQNFTSSASPLVVYKIDDTYHIIDGCKRYNRAKNEHHNSCCCNVVDSIQNTTHASLLRISLNLGRFLSFTEKYLFLYWLKTNLPENDYHALSEQIAVSPRERYDIEQVFGSSTKILSCIEQGNLDLSLAPELLTMKIEDQDVFLSFFSKLQFSRSMQRELIEWVPEIAFRNSSTVQMVLESAITQDILNHKSMNLPQKMQKIRDSFFADRFPVIAEIKNQWASLSRKLNPDPSHIQFLPSEGFEKNRLEIKITISNSNEILSIFEKFKNISSEEWEKLIYPAKNFGRIDPEK